MSCRHRCKTTEHLILRGICWYLTVANVFCQLELLFCHARVSTAGRVTASASLRRLHNSIATASLQHRNFIYTWLSQSHFVADVQLRLFDGNGRPNKHSRAFLRLVT